MKNIIYILIFYFITGFSSAQEKISLKDCVNEALKNNLNIKSTQSNQKITEQTIKEAKSGLFPHISLNGQYSYYLELPKQLINASLFGGDGYIEGAMALSQNAQVSAQLQQALYNGQVWQGLKAAQAGRELDNVNIIMTKENVAYNVEATYYNIQILTKNIELIQGNIDNINKLIDATNSLVKNQLAIKTDYNRLVVSKKNLETTLQYTQLNREKSYNMLKFLMGRKIQESISIEPFAEDKSLSISFDVSLETVYTKHSGIKQIEVYKTLKEFQRKSIAATYWPTLFLVGNYTFAGYNDSFAPFTYINGKFFPSSYVGLQLNINLFDGMYRKSQINKVRAEIEQYNIQSELLKEQISLDIQNAINDYKSNLATLTLQEDNMQLAKEVYNDRQIQYKNGLININDVVMADNELREAQTNYINSLINIRNAELNYKKAKGELLNNLN